MTTLPPASLPEDFWETRFQANRTPWERGALNPAFLEWRATTLHPCRILIPGAGKSPEPAALLHDGFDVVTIDLAQSAIDHQSPLLGPARAIQADVTTWRPAPLFDAVYDQTCLCALPPPLWPAYEASLRAWLRPGGHLYILLMQTGTDTGPPFDCPIPAMRTLFATWLWPDTLSPSLPHGLGGAEQPVILTKPA